MRYLRREQPRGRSENSTRRADPLRRDEARSRVVHDDGRMRYQRRLQSRGRSEVSLPRANAVPKAAALARAPARGTARSVSPRIGPPYCDPLYTANH